MQPVSRPGLRGLTLGARLVLLVALAAAPALVILALLAVDGYRVARDRAYERGLFAVREAAAAYGHALRTAETLLAIAAQSPLTDRTSPAACSDFLRGLLEAHHGVPGSTRFTALHAAAPDGEVYCGGVPSDGFAVGDREYFQEALATGRFTAGEQVMGRRSGELLIPVALAKPSPDGTPPSSVLIAGLRLDSLGEGAVGQATEGGLVTLLNGSGLILARGERHDDWVGRPYPGFGSIVRALGPDGEGFAERPGVDGVERLYTAKRLEVGPNRFYLLVGYRTVDVFRHARESLAFGFALVAVAGAALLAAAVYGARRFIAEPVRRLSEAAGRMSEGDLGVRVEVDGGTELARLGLAFNDMATALQTRAAELADANELLSAIIDSAPFAIFVVDAGTKVVSWNAAAEQVYGWTAAEVVGRAFPAVPEDQRESFLSYRSEALAGAALQQYEAERARKDGRRIRLRCWAAPLRSRVGDFRGTLYIAEDITERRALEQQLAQAQKMEAVGQLTGGVAHDFNNLLQVILGCADLLLEQIPAEDERRPMAEMMQSAAERGAALTAQLLAFSRRQALEPKRIDANEVVRSVEPMLRRTLGEAIELIASLAPDLGAAFADRGQLESALVNLAVNARDAMPDGGRLILETANVTLDEAYAAGRAEVTPGDYVMIGVSDTGTGMAPAVLARIFDPFFTTKAPGKGTGLGLSMVFGFIKQSKGHVSAYSEVGHGTTLRLYLPRLAAGPAEAEAAPAPAPAAVASAPTVLYVEDDPDVRRFGLIQLTALGCRVIEAAGAAEALAVLDGPQPVDLLFTDVILGADMNGWELSERVREARPRMKVLYASGYNEAVIVRDGKLRPGVQLLRKPYRRADLARKLAELFAGDGATQA